MPGLDSFRYFLVLFSLVLFLVSKSSDAERPFHCEGAHPADGLLYQNPDLFHDFYVFKCVTTVLFTSGDRGRTTGNFSYMLERGLEDAYSYMAGTAPDETAWDETHVQFNGKVILFRSLKDVPQVQILYLRLPSGTADGSGYAANDGESLKRLYDGDIKSLTAIDGSSTYTLESLQDLLGAILKKRAACDIRVLDFKTPLPGKNNDGSDHADHSVSAKVVVDVWKREQLGGNLRGYAANFMRRLSPTLNVSTMDYRVKLNVFLQYAAQDKDMCKDYDNCFEVERSGGPYLDEDFKFVPTWMEREYYVS
ncbi:uncharacterized protein BDR25DRAFT_364780 [Lindgomyces ingoldianus]|uniref:Uncharacterized protein n=1 Tax=Lindgomyces ingoldianus TaxID=673940 RepID=A0ACB6REP5_9PLEO|nr:uncharacterized protein BDR25DRAFT_364780 [Lindgomyces ingoldianus]KAF2477814.1 hypothetical protein BDR25DRAFT_364780 [Lindgomyces ingoldianus]